MIAGEDLLATNASALVSSYVPADRDKRLAAEIDRLLQISLARFDATVPAPREAPGLVVVGASGAGKTTAILRQLGRHSRLPGFGVDGELCPLVSIDAPAPATLLQLGRALLRATGYPLTSDPRRHVLWELVRDRLRRTNVVAIHIDEFHNVTRAANVVERDQILATLKSLMNDRTWPVALLLSGLPEVVEFLNGDPQVARRMRAVSFDRLKAPLDVPFVAKVIDKFCVKAGCPAPENFGTAVAPRLIHAAAGSLGVLVEIVIEAIGCALRRSQSLDIQHFGDAYAIRTACLRSANPFLVDDTWEAVEVTRLLAVTARTEPANPKPGGSS